MILDKRIKEIAKLNFVKGEPFLNKVLLASWGGGISAEMVSLYLIAKPPPSCLIPLRPTPHLWGFHHRRMSTQSIRLRATYSTRGLHAFCFIGAICSLRQLSDRLLNQPGNLYDINCKSKRLALRTSTHTG